MPCWCFEVLSSCWLLRDSRSLSVSLRSFGSILDRSVTSDIVTILCELSLTSSKFLGQVLALSLLHSPPLSDSSTSQKDSRHLMLWVCSPPSSLSTTLSSSPLQSLRFKLPPNSPDTPRTISANCSPPSLPRQSPCC
jgi:hypothetical protein